ncbi:hypothetical protein BH20ACT7_BH20ACT7_15550 [soil metagenome]
MTRLVVNPLRPARPVHRTEQRANHPFAALAADAHDLERLCVNGSTGLAPPISPAASKTSCAASGAPVLVVFDEGEGGYIPLDADAANLLKDRDLGRIPQRRTAR